jgi:hypothetical protein
MPSSARLVSGSFQLGLAQLGKFQLELITTVNSFFYLKVAKGDASDPHDFNM